MKESNATTQHQLISPNPRYELIEILFTAVKRIESKGYNYQEIEKMIDDAMSEILPANIEHGSTTSSCNGSSSAAFVTGA